MKKTLLFALTCMSTLAIKAQMTSDFTVGQPSSSTACDGFLSINVNGVQPYTYVWNATDTSYGDPIMNSYDTLVNVCSGMYFVDVYDSMGDSIHYDFILTSPDYSFGSQYTPSDSVVSVFIEDCSFDYSIPITDVYLYDIDFYGDNSFDLDTLISYWHIVQSVDTIVVTDTAINYFPSSTNFVLDAAIYCPDSVVKSLNLVGPIIHVATPLNGASLSVLDHVITEQKLMIYPNPFTDVITILASEEEMILSYAIYSVSGQLIMSKEVINSSLLTINFSEIPPGIYFIKTEQKSGNKTQKIIKKSK